MSYKVCFNCGEDVKKNRVKEGFYIKKDAKIIAIEVDLYKCTHCGVECYPQSSVDKMIAKGVDIKK